MHERFFEITGERYHEIVFNFLIKENANIDLFCKISHGKILSRAMDLCREETGDCVWPDIPERYWAQAVNELIG